MLEANQCQPNLVDVVEQIYVYRFLRSFELQVVSCFLRVSHNTVVGGGYRYDADFCNMVVDCVVGRVDRGSYLFQGSLGIRGGPPRSPNNGTA